jgi:hypothetical protein
LWFLFHPHPRRQPGGNLREPVGSFEEPTDSVIKPTGFTGESIGSVGEPIGKLVEPVGSLVEPIGLMNERAAWGDGKWMAFGNKLRWTSYVWLSLAALLDADNPCRLKTSDKRLIFWAVINQSHRS